MLQATVIVDYGTLPAYKNAIENKRKS